MMDKPKFIFSLGFVLSYLCLVLWIISGFYLQPPLDTIFALGGLFSFMFGYVLLLGGITALSPFKMGGKGWHLKAISIIVALLIPLRLFMERYINDYPIIKDINGIMLILALTILLLIILIRVKNGKGRKRK